MFINNSILFTSVKTYIMKEEQGKFMYAPLRILERPSMIKIVDNSVRMEIIKLLSEKAMYPAEIAKKLKLHEQIVYYHVKQLANADIISVVEKKEVRGTIAKKFSTTATSFGIRLSDDWHEMENILSSETDDGMAKFLAPFIDNGIFSGKFVVGSPDPHGPYKARARDSHYAIDLSLFLGKYASLPKDFIVSLDVDVNIETDKGCLVLVGGPATNLVVASVNASLPVKFMEGKGWGLHSDRTGKKYSDEAIGIIAKVPNPHFPDMSLLVIAGISSPGTKSAVLALTRYNKLLLKSYKDQPSWATVVHGFDVDGDGKIDSVEILE